MQEIAGYFGSGKSELREIAVEAAERIRVAPGDLERGADLAAAPVAPAPKPAAQEREPTAAAADVAVAEPETVSEEGQEAAPVETEGGGFQFDAWARSLEEKSRNRRKGGVHRGRGERKRARESPETENHGASTVRGNSGRHWPWPRALAPGRRLIRGPGKVRTGRRRSAPAARGGAGSTGCGGVVTGTARSRRTPTAGGCTTSRATRSFGSNTALKISRTRSEPRCRDRTTWRLLRWRISTDGTREARSNRDRYRQLLGQPPVLYLILYGLAFAALARGLLQVTFRAAVAAPEAAVAPDG